jgi:hypothetical protein
MAPGTSGTPIIRYFSRYDSPTGDLGYCQTAEGTVWHIVSEHPATQDTGDRRGEIRDGKVYE